MIKMVCKNGHKYDTYPSRIKDGRGCPYCSGQRVCYENSLAEKYPEIAKEWDYEKNTKCPSDYTSRSGKRVWWKCVNGHGWDATISNRTTGRKCPYCSGKKACDENSFLKNHPELAKQWDYSKNTIDIKTLTKGSNRKVWWICEKGHSYESTLVGRVFGNGCPYCYGRKASPENNVLIKFPEVIADWDYSKNNKRPEDYSGNSGERIRWKCRVCKEEWSQKICTRTGQKTGCPYCTGRNATATDNLLVKNPRLCKEWDYEKNIFGPKEYRVNSGKKAWWKCKICGNGWKAAIYHRTSGTGCPYCIKIILKDGAVCDSLTEAYFYLDYKKRGVLFEQHKQYPNSDRKFKCDFFLVKENKYVEVTGFYQKKQAKKQT